MSGMGPRPSEAALTESGQFAETQVSSIAEAQTFPNKGQGLLWKITKHVIDKLERTNICLNGS